MEFGLKELFFVFGIILTGVTTFFTTKHNIHNYTRDKFEELNSKLEKEKNELNKAQNDFVVKTKDEIADLKLEIERLKHKLELQNSIITQFREQILDNLPQIITNLMKK